MTDLPLGIKVNEHIRLELIGEKHAKALLDVVNKNRAYLREWLPWVDDMQTVENFRAYINLCQRQHDAGTDLSFVVWCNEQIAGRIGIHYIHPHNRCGAIGYWLGQEYTGTGIMTNACIALINYGFSVLKLNRIEIKCATNNDKSAAIPERLGFTKEGILRQAELVNSKFVDLKLYSMLKDEWSNRVH